MKGLLTRVFFYKNRHYPVFPSKAPEPTPIPCGKCNLFTHTTDTCTTPTKCNKCGGTHSTLRCTSTLPAKCAACGSTDHEAWSRKCPNHPKVPVAGLPITRLKPINTKTENLPKELISSRIHAPLTIHDHIVNCYNDKLNNSKISNRDELLAKLNKRFINNFSIATTVVFSGSFFYVLMFDMHAPNSQSPTKPTHGMTQAILDNNHGRT